MARKRNDILVPLSVGSPEVVQAIQDVSGASKSTATAIERAFERGYGLATASERQLEHLGATPAQAKKIVGAFRLHDVCDRACQQRAPGGPVSTPDAVVRFIRSAIAKENQEYFIVLLLDARQRIIDARGVALGTLASVDVHPREVFKDAVRLGAHSIIIAHNHPSGDAEPSQADIDLTKRMTKIGEMHGIPVLDHIVIAPHDHTSLASMGMMR